MTARCTCMPENLGDTVAHKSECPVVTGAMPPDVVLRVVLTDDGSVYVYSREPTTRAGLAKALRNLADGFESARRTG